MNAYAEYANAPPYAMSVGYTLSLRAKTFQAARARIEGLVATAVDANVIERALEITEAADTRKLSSLSPRSADRIAAFVEQSGHTLGLTARAAWERYGPARDFSGLGVPDVVRWRWPEVEGAYDFLVAHPSGGVRAEVEFWFRLRTRAGEVVGEPLPPSKITAFFAEDGSRAYVNLVLPHTQATTAFFDDVDAISRAFTLKIAPSRFEVSHPSKSGDRVFRKLQMQ
jgi:hypothetical protein